MKLSISHIGWQAENDKAVYDQMKKYGYSGLEIAPTRIFPEQPYDQLTAAGKWVTALWAEHGFSVPSMQSIWFGRQEKVFGTKAERRILLDYTKKSIDFAEVIGCKNLVFGCPRNRNLPEGADSSVAVDFFRELGDYALRHNTVIGMEANPPIYHTNYINDTLSALALIQSVDSDGFRLNLDIGTMIQNGEEADILIGNVHLINHVHLSEPGLKMIEERELHKKIKRILVAENYRGFVSIEMGKTDDLCNIEMVLKYGKEIFSEAIV